MVLAPHDHLRCSNMCECIEYSGGLDQVQAKLFILWWALMMA